MSSKVAGWKSFINGGFNKKSSNYMDGFHGDMPFSNFNIDIWKTNDNDIVGSMLSLCFKKKCYFCSYLKLPKGAHKSPSTND